MNGMSRLGRQPIVLPTGVSAELAAGLIVIKGPKGELKEEIHSQVQVELKDKTLFLSVKDEKDRKQKALWGLFASLIRNMIVGVTEGFVKQLEINGIGFGAAVSGRNLVLNIGFSHPVNFSIPAGLEIKVEKNLISISGISKQLVGEVAAQIRRLKKPEPYKGKGIKYIDEQIVRKTGKTVVAKTL